MVEKTIYTKYAVDRKKEFAVQTSILDLGNKRIVRKRALFPEANCHIKRMVENCKILTSIYGEDHVAQCLKYNDTEFDMEYINGERLSDILEQLIARHEIKKYESLLNRYIEFVKISSSDEVDVYSISKEDLSTNNRISNIDFIFDNIIVRNDDFVVIDYEWLVPKIDYRIVLFRALFIFELRAKNDRYLDEINKKLMSDHEMNSADYYKNINDDLIKIVADYRLDNYKKNIYEAVISSHKESLMLKQAMQACVDKDNIIQAMERDFQEKNNIIHALESDIQAIKSTRGFKFLEKMRAVRKLFFR